MRRAAILGAVALAGVLSAAGATDAGAQAAGAQEVSETLAELNALGLQVEVRAAEATGVQSATAPLTSPSGAGAASAETTENRVQSFWERLRDSLVSLFQGTTNRMVQDALEGIQGACRINQTAAEGGLELASVAISLGGVTFTFSPSPGFCESVPLEGIEQQAVAPLPPCW